MSDIWDSIAEPSKESKLIIDEAFNLMDVHAEMQKCIESPFYFATNYMNVNGEKFKTKMSEIQFNTLFKDL